MASLWSSVLAWVFLFRSASRVHWNDSFMVFYILHHSKPGSRLCSSVSKPLRRRPALNLCYSLVTFCWEWNRWLAWPVHLTGWLFGTVRRFQSTFSLGMFCCKTKSEDAPAPYTCPIWCTGRSSGDVYMCPSFTQHHYKLLSRSFQITFLNLI